MPSNLGRERESEGSRYTDSQKERERERTYPTKVVLASLPNETTIVRVLRIVAFPEAEHPVSSSNCQERRMAWRKRQWVYKTTNGSHNRLGSLCLDVKNAHLKEREGGEWSKNLRWSLWQTARSMDTVMIFLWTGSTAKWNTERQWTSG